MQIIKMLYKILKEIILLKQIMWPEEKKFLEI